MAEAQSRVRAPDLEAFCIEAMRTADLREQDARLTAEVLVTTDTWGVHTHGTRQLRGLLKNVRDGRLSASAKPAVTAEGAGWAMIDGQFAMPPATAYRAMERAVTKAQSSGVGYVGVRRSSHFGAAGFYANLAARHGMIGIAVTNVDPVMTVPGARGKVLGSNPIAYAAPAGRIESVFLDIATSVAAVTKIFNAKTMGQPIPEGWMVDDEGRPSTDARLYPEHGTVVPMAAHKGYGLAVLVEILGAVLTGASIASAVTPWGAENVGPTDQGHAFIAINVSAMMPIEEFRKRMDGLIVEIQGAPKAKGSDRIYLPGEMEWEHRTAALADGMILPPYVVESLRGLAADTGTDPKRFSMEL
jgi:ureidoglycolate dehydrogenase (NAD+)